jgi:hypothetical protein
MLPITTLARRLFSAVKAVAQPVADHQRLYFPVAMPLLDLVMGRLWRVIGRFDRLVLKWERGQLPAARVRARRATAARKAATPVLRLPARFGWLLKLVPLAHMGNGHLRYMLEDPESGARELVAAAPQAGRILRPLCRILGTPVPDWLALPKRKRKPRPPQPRATPSARGERQGPARGFTRRQIDGMTAAELLAHYGRLPPHFPLPIPNLGYIRRKIAAG